MSRPRPGQPFKLTRSARSGQTRPIRRSDGSISCDAPGPTRGTDVPREKDVGNRPGTGHRVRSSPLGLDPFWCPFLPVGRTTRTLPRGFRESQNAGERPASHAVRPVIPRPRPPPTTPFRRSSSSRPSLACRRFPAVGASRSRRACPSGGEAGSPRPPSASSDDRTRTTARGRPHEDGHGTRPRNGDGVCGRRPGRRPHTPWRRAGDSNPRCIAAQRFSRPSHSAALSALLAPARVMPTPRGAVAQSSEAASRAGGAAPGRTTTAPPLGRATGPWRPRVRDELRRRCRAAGAWPAAPGR